MHGGSVFYNDPHVNVSYDSTNILQVPLGSPSGVQVLHFSTASVLDPESSEIACIHEFIKERFPISGDAEVLNWINFYALPSLSLFLSRVLHEKAPIVVISSLAVSPGDSKATLSNTFSEDDLMNAFHHCKRLLTANYMPSLIFLNYDSSRDLAVRLCKFALVPFAIGITDNVSGQNRELFAASILSSLAIGATFLTAFEAAQRAVQSEGAKFEMYHPDTTGVEPPPCTVRRANGWSVLSTGLSAENVDIKLRPSALLLPSYSPVPFTWRCYKSSMKSELDDWCNDSIKDISFRIFTGGGGVGKTRLFIEYCRLRRQHGWDAGFLPPGPVTAWVKQKLQFFQPTLIVVDFAEVQLDTLKNLASFLRDYSTKYPNGAGQCVRVALLARQVGDWFDNVFGKTFSQSSGKIVPVDECIDKPTRVSLYQEALQRFQEKLRDQKSDNFSVDPDLSHDRYSSVLYIHVFALETVLKCLENPPLHQLYDDIIDHEMDFWRNGIPHQLILSDDVRFSYKTKMRNLRWLLTFLTLNGESTDEDVRGFLSILKMEKIDKEVLTGFMRSIYGCQNEGIGGVQPDILVEGIIYWVIDKDFIERGCIIDAHWQCSKHEGKHLFIKFLASLRDKGFAKSMDHLYSILYSRYPDVITEHDKNRQSSERRRNHGDYIMMILKDIVRQMVQDRPHFIAHEFL